MITYIDINDGYKCYTSDNSGILLTYEIDYFDGKCTQFIEGYRCVPEGYTWTREDGEVFTGEMISPWKNYTELEKAQFEYEIEQLKTQNAEYDTALTEIEQALEVGK